MRKRFKSDKHNYQVDLLSSNPLTVEITENEETRRFSFDGELKPNAGRIFLDGKYVPYYVTETGKEIWVTIGGRTYVYEKSKGGAAIDDGHSGFSTPMPGKVIQVLVESGAEVKEGDVLVIMEAMKMEHRIEAPCDGTVLVMHAEANAVVPQGYTLLDFQAAE